MDWLPAASAGLRTAIALGAVGLAAALAWRSATGGGRALVVAPTFFVAAVIGLPRLFGADSSSQLLSALGAAAALSAAGFLGAVAARGWRGARRALATPRAASVRDALEMARERPGLDLCVEGPLLPEPALTAPLSGARCAAWRLEVRRSARGDAALLVGQDEACCERVRVGDEAAAVALAGAAARLLRDAPVQRTKAVATCDAAALASAGALANPVVELARRHDADPPAEGAVRYELVEQRIPAGGVVCAAGRIARLRGTETLEPIAARLAYGAGRDLPKILMVGAVRLACGAVLLVAAGAVLLSGALRG